MRFRPRPKNPEKTLDAQRYVELIAETLEPDEDWLPGLFVSGAKRGTSIVVLDPAFDSDELSDVIEDVLEKHDADRAVLWATSWIVTGDDVDPAVRPSESPAKVEAVVLQAMEGARRRGRNGRTLRAASMTLQGLPRVLHFPRISEIRSWHCWS